MVLKQTLLFLVTLNILEETSRFKIYVSLNKSYLVSRVLSTNLDRNQASLLIDHLKCRDMSPI